jgi:hypothetical protein
MKALFCGRMNTFTKFLSTATGLLLLCGCNSPVPEVGAEEPIAAEVEPVEQGAFPRVGKVTFIRIEPEPSADELIVSVTGTMSAVVGNFSYSAIRLPEGTNFVTLDWDDTPLKFEEEIVIDAEGGLNKYFNVAHRFAVPEISKKEGGTDYTLEETLVLWELPASLATNLIKTLDPDFSYSFDFSD